MQYPASFAASAIGRDREALVVDLGRNPLGIERLDGASFNVPVRIDILHRVVRYLRAKWQQGTHKAKTRSEVSGGSRKPRPQKKTGRSRQGSIRSPLWKGGGATFGPRPRSHAHKLPRNVQLLGMKCALSAKLNEGRMVVVDSLACMHGAPVKPRMLAPRLEELVAQLSSRGSRTALMVDLGESDRDGGRPLRNAAGTSKLRCEVLSVDQLTVYHVLKYQALVISRPALARLAETLRNPPHRNRMPLRMAWWARERSAFDQAVQELQGAAAAAASKQQAAASGSS